ncbi:hypothetical protein GOBAR_AA25904 [Gossypium barbadense]|uniref:NAC domain-containing protein n=1 Tax=Gossypium barbadense TaxID=3634 RepID=A0A2P5WUK5_GOSBA|nr:hypothetical protein GOBAR_AA25904 [Gossypium barbadense]
MSNISLVEAKLPPGFRFHPKDEELVCDYLMKKVASADTLQLMIEVDLNKCEPWDIPETAGVGGKEWYFYSKRDRKYATGLRTNRATCSGYWKATGKDRAIHSKGMVVGMRKTLVFYNGRAPKGTKSDWVMHEFRLDGTLSPPNLSTLKVHSLLKHFRFRVSDLIILKFQHPYLISDQTGLNSDEQVPCFSVLSQTDPNSFKVDMQPNMPTETLTSSSSVDHQQQQQMKPATNDITSCLDSFPRDKMVIKAVLNNLTQLDTYLNVKESTSFDEGISSDQSYLSGIWDCPTFGINY